MKLLKIIGIVVGLHLLVGLLLVGVPACSSTSKPAAATAAAAPKPDPAPTVAMPAAAPAGDVPTISAAPAPEAPPAGGAFYSPTRPNTPAASALETQPAPDVVPATTYTVAHGDSLWTIAKKNHLKVSELAAANNLKSGSALKLGQKLIIPAKAPAAPAPSSPAGPGPLAAAPAAPAAGANAQPPSGAAKASTEITYTVRANDTLGSIARKFRVRVADLATANNISDPAKIRPGQTLKIRGAGTAGTKRTPKSGGAGSPAAAAPASPAPPPAGQDLDAGAPPAAGGDVPLIKISGSADAAPAATPAPAN